MPAKTTRKEPADARADARTDARAVSTRRLKDNASRKPRSSGKSDDDARERKLGEKVAFAIKRDIAEAGWPVGEVLGNQGELMKRYKVSRSTLREAVRQVERHGVARMRRGIGGGLVVQQPARGSAVLALASYLELAAVKLSELFEARELLEGLMVELACERATDADLARMRALYDQLMAGPADDLAQEVKHHFELRSAIAALPRNPALALLIESLYRVTSDMLTVSADDPRLPELARASRKEKRLLVDALLAGDVVAGRLEVRSTIKRSRKLVEAELREQGLTFEQASAVDLSAEADPSGTSGLYKLGHRVSLRIARDIAASDAAPGSRLGSEPELRERYGVSRAVFREALRTLELHCIVQLRRGYSGGMVIGVPDPSYTAELATIYFQYARLKPRHFYEMWRSLQLASAQLAAQRITAAGKQRLEAVIAAQKAATHEQIPAVHGRLHLEISDLSGNRVLALFTRIMSDIAAYYPTDIPPAETWQVLSGSHAEVAAAIGKGDAPLSRRLMARHMKLVDAWYGNTERENWLHSLEKTPESA